MFVHNIVKYFETWFFIYFIYFLFICIGNRMIWRRTRQERNTSSCTSWLSQPVTRGGYGMSCWMCCLRVEILQLVCSATCSLRLRRGQTFGRSWRRRLESSTDRYRHMSSWGTWSIWGGAWMNVGLAHYLLLSPPPFSPSLFFS